MVDGSGGTDCGWVWILIGLNALVVTGYVRIFRFWRRAYLSTEARDRNKKLMDLAWIFLWCASCGYVSSIVMFFWPGYRLLGLMLIPLAFFTWRFAMNLEPFRVSLSAKRLERELAESLSRRNEELEAQVAERTEELERAVRLADTANEAKSSFLATMSHEIRTPMNAVVGFADLLAEDREDEARHGEHLATIRRNTDHLLDLINDVLDLAKVESGKMELHAQPMDLHGALRDIADLFGPKASAQGVSLGLEISSSVPREVMCDPTRLRQVVSNLVGNAVKFTEEGSVRIEAEGDGGDVLVRVRDTGPGIVRADRERLFEAFTQASDRRSRRKGGTGLGLAIGRDLAGLMGGGLTLDSVEGTGSVFTLRLPATPVGGGSIEVARGGCDRVTPGALSGVRVLLAEDGEDNARLATAFLERAGASVVRVADGSEAVELIEGDGPAFDLVLLDLQMPVMDGDEAAVAIRGLGFDVPLVVVTASAYEEDRERCLRAGFDGFVAKPITRSGLIEACLALVPPPDRRAA